MVTVIGEVGYPKLVAYAQPKDATLTALAAYNTNGLLTQTAPDTFTGRTLTGTANRIGVTNGDGVAGNPTLDIGSDVVTLTGVQTLTNKTLTTPTLTNPVLSTYMEIIETSSAPSAPAQGRARLFVYDDNSFGIVPGPVAGPVTKFPWSIYPGNLSAERFYTLPDASGTLLTSTATIADANNNALTNILTLVHNINGGGASLGANFGVGLLFQGQSNNVASRSMAGVIAGWEDSTDGTRKGKLTLRAFNGAANVNAVVIGTTSITILDGHTFILGTTTGTKWGTSASQKQAWWGAAPVIQSVGWAVTNPVTRKTFDTTTVTLQQLAEVVGTLITRDLSYGLAAA